MPLLPRAALVALALGSLAGCGTPVGVSRADPKAVHRELTASVLSTGRPSATTWHVLERQNLRAIFDADPDAAIAKLHESVVSHQGDRRLLALAELSFLRGEQTGDRSRHLACAVYAWALLFPGEGDSADLAPSDPRLRLAYDLYNRGLTAGLAADDGRHVDLSSRAIVLPFGTLTLRAPDTAYQWAGYRVDDFVAAANLSVRGLRNRYRRPGIGAPLAASVRARIDGGSLPPGHYRIPARSKVPVTALLRIEGARAALASGQIAGSFSLHAEDEARDVEIDGRRVPLELETTSTLAFNLEGAPIWDMELAGFFSSAMKPVTALFGDDPLIERARPEDGLFLRTPHRAGRIPVVLVHGTASSTARWAEMVNELENDRRIGDHYEAWLFLYNTGNPIAYSGGLLRHALENTVAELDPDGRDPALRQMVVIGHSQGGLLTKLTAVSSGDRFWRNTSKRSFAEVDLDPGDREVLRRSLFFEPLPFVRRVIFIATPHHGSYLASLSVARLVGSIISLPTNVLRAGFEVFIDDPVNEAMRAQRRLPTSIDNMTPGNPFLEALASLPIAPGVAAHSIIAVNGDGPPERGSDGVVRYESAHIEGVESETIVRSFHSTQGHPDTIEEVRRILLEHAGE